MVRQSFKNKLLQVDEELRQRERQQQKKENAKAGTAKRVQPSNVKPQKRRSSVRELQIKGKLDDVNAVAEASGDEDLVSRNSSDGRRKSIKGLGTPTYNKFDTKLKKEMMELNAQEEA